MVARARKDGQSEEKSEIALEKHPVDEIFDQKIRKLKRKLIFMWLKPFFVDLSENVVC